MRRAVEIFAVIALLFFADNVIAATTTTVNKNSVQPVTNKTNDSDLDGLKDTLEVALGTDLNNPDTDGDGYKDGDEVYSGYNPLAGNRDRNVRRHVEVDLTKQQMYVYFNNIKIGAIPVSTGVRRTPTPKGTFEVFAKKPVVHYVGPGYDLPNTKWNLEFKKSFYLHGAYWHNHFGLMPMSHGCVNIAYVDAEYLYKYMDVGDKVWVYGKTPAGMEKIARRS